MTTIDESRDEYLILLSRFGQEGASGSERKQARDASGHRWTAGMVQQDEDVVDSHLCEWVGGSHGPKENLRLTSVGLFWAATARLTKEHGLTHAEVLKQQLKYC
jgi:hypothetical protein